MLKEVTNYVFDRGVEAGKKTNENKVNFLDRLSDPRTIVFELNGVITEREVKPDLRRHSVDSVNDLLSAAEKWGEAGVIWLSAEQAVLVTDDDDRREYVRLPLHYSTVFKTLVSLNDHNNARMEQLTLVRLLRRELRHSPQSSTLLAAVRKIKFRSTTSGHSDLQHGNESLGSAIEAEVSGADNIAETLIVPTAIYSNPGEEDNGFEVGLDLEIDVHKQRFILRPMPDEIERAITSALARIKERLEESGLLVLYGTP